MIIISACLAGIACRYDGESAVLEEARILVSEGKAIPVCPEQWGGLSTPRSPSEIVSGDGEDVLNGKSRVINAEGKDVTEQFVKGAWSVVSLAKLAGIKKALLKSGSPACGYGYVRRKGRLVKGNGVTAALLLREGIEVVGK